MKRALLVGNGVTSQLIQEYKDIYMMAEFKKRNAELYYDINEMLNPFRNLQCKEKEDIIQLLESMGIEYHHYYRYFILQNLINEINYPEILGIETLLKVAHLFNHVREFDYNKVKLIANQIYYNDGHNGLDAINSNKLNREKFCSCISNYNFIFTTNFDNVLDEATNNEVYHLHGGFFYKRESHNRSTFIRKTTEIQTPERAHLIWGKDDKEKIEQARGGISFPLIFPAVIGSSVLNIYLDKLSNSEFEELHIWGYSGLNDGHINSAIKQNKSIKKIIYYGDPESIMDEDYCNKIKEIFSADSEKDRVFVLSWNDMWHKVSK